MTGPSNNNDNIMKMCLTAQETSLSASLQFAAKWETAEKADRFSSRHHQQGVTARAWHPSNPCETLCPSSRETSSDTTPQPVRLFIAHSGQPRSHWLKPHCGNTAKPEVCWAHTLPVFPTATAGTHCPSSLEANDSSAASGNHRHHRSHSPTNIPYPNKLWFSQSAQRDGKSKTEMWEALKEGRNGDENRSSKEENQNSAIIYSPSCHTKPMCCYSIHGTQNEAF